MVFNSVTFLIFLAVTLLVYYRLGFRAQNRLLIVASYVFYGWWDWRFLGLLLFSTVFDYYCALWIEREMDGIRRRWFLAFSMIVNMGVLCIFKYFNFFAESLRLLLAGLGIEASFPTLHVILPVGISFYTFLSMSYTIDVYRSELKATRNLTEFMLYVSFFPHLVAGPIVRASYLLPQCQRPRVVQPAEVTNGIWLILVGFVKKVVIADRLAEVVNWGFGQGAPPFPDANSWLIIYAFAFQIYGDFSGYSDIARGLSKLMGFELVENFRAPYLVTNPSEFWRHWHISLSTWLRDYLYIPLGGNRKGGMRTYGNLMLTMLLGGLWHGAGAAYLLWGLYHGILLAVHRAWLDLVSRLESKRDPSAGFWPWGKRAFLILFFFHLTCVGWLLFRAGALPSEFSQVAAVRSYLQAMSTLPAGLSVSPLAYGVGILGCLTLLLQWQQRAMDRFAGWPTWLKAGSMVVALSAIVSLGVFEGAQFIYFQF